MFNRVAVSQLDHTDNDCLCIVTLTHGIQNDLICAKDVVYSSDKLWKPFAGDKCKTLAGKPKLFFIQVKQLHIFESHSIFKLSTYLDTFLLCLYFIQLGYLVWLFV